MMHDWGFGWGWGGGMFFGPLFMIAGPLLFIVVVVMLVRLLGGSSAAPGARLRSGRETLDDRFARGEIQREEYEERRKALGA
jgi:putative membrane protein